MIVSFRQLSNSGTQPSFETQEPSKAVVAYDEAESPI